MKMMKPNKELKAYQEPQLTTLLVAVEQGFYASDDPQIDPAEGEDDFGEF